MRQVEVLRERCALPGWARWALAALFALACCGILLFVQLFTNSEAAFVAPAWERAAVVGSDDAETGSFDPAGAAPELAEGERYRYELTMPDARPEGTWLVFDTAGLALTVRLDGVELWRSASVQGDDVVNLGQAMVPLPSGGGETLQMDVEVLGGTALFPPLPRLAADPWDNAGDYAYANGYGLAAGANALALALLVGLLLLGVASGRSDVRLLLPIAAAAALLVNRLAIGFGALFLPEGVASVLSDDVWSVAAALALVAWLALHRERAFWRAFAPVAAASAAGLALVVLLAFALRPDGPLARYLVSLVVDQLATGYYVDVLYWATWWLVLVCALLSAWELVRAQARTQARAQALSLKNQLVMESYHAIEGRLREDAAVRHEAAHRLTALDALAREGDLAGVRDLVARWQGAATGTARPRLARNPVIDAMLQDAAARAERAGVAFTATALVPTEVPLPVEDLCALVMNMLDNALEAASRPGAAPAEGRPFVNVTLRESRGHLVVRCENSFDGTVLLDRRGALRTRKEDAASHGLGLQQMREVARRHGGELDVSWDDRVFRVSCALTLRDG